jgi:hypothetical protein
VTAVDARYSHRAEESLYGELAVALNIAREAVEEYIACEIDGQKSALHSQRKVL